MKNDQIVFCLSTFSVKPEKPQYPIQITVADKRPRVNSNLTLMLKRKRQPHSALNFNCTCCTHSVSDVNASNVAARKLSKCFYRPG